MLYSHEQIFGCIFCFAKCADIVWITSVLKLVTKPLSIRSKYQSMVFLLLSSKSDFHGYMIIDSMNVGPCHHGMARPRVADGGMASNMEGSCE